MLAGHPNVSQMTSKYWKNRDGFRLPLFTMTHLYILLITTNINNTSSANSKAIIFNDAKIVSIIYLINHYIQIHVCCSCKYVVGVNVMFHIVQKNQVLAMRIYFKLKCETLTTLSLSLSLSLFSLFLTNTLLTLYIYEIYGVDSQVKVFWSSTLNSLWYY